MTSNMQVPFMRHTPETHYFTVNLNRWPSYERTGKPLIRCAYTRPKVSLVKGEGLILPKRTEVAKPVRKVVKPKRVRTKKVAA